MKPSHRVGSVRLKSRGCPEPLARLGLVQHQASRLEGKFCYFADWPITLLTLQVPPLKAGLHYLGLFSWGRVRGDLIAVCKYLKCGSQVNRARRFSVVCSNRSKDSEHKLKHGKFHTNTRKNLFTVRVTEHWNRLFRDVLESPSL